MSSSSARKMITRGILTFLLFACQALSSPVPNIHSKADAKVMKCIVEVISDILSKPSPLPTSKECMEALRKDERIISVLRHQDLLRELQELAAEGVSEKALEGKQTKVDTKELYATKSQVDKKSLIDESSDSPGDDWEGPVVETTEREDVEDQAQDDKSVTQSSPETNLNGDKNADSNEPTTDSVSHIISRLSLRERKRTAKKLDLSDVQSLEKNSPDQDVERVGEERGAEPGEGWATKGKGATEVRPAKGSEEYEEEEIAEDLADDEGDEEEEEEEVGDGEGDKPVEESKDDGSQSALREHGSNRDGSEVEKVKDSLVEEIQANENRRSPADWEDEEMREGDKSIQEKKSQEKESSLSEEWKESKRWSKMDELTRELNSRKRDEASEEKGDRSMLAGRQRPGESRTPKAHNKHNKFKNSWEEAKHELSEDSQEKRYRSFLKVHNMDEKKDEEGSASRRNEEHELESLAQIENELEDVAWKLHEIRQSY